MSGDSATRSYKHRGLALRNSITPQMEYYDQLQQNRVPYLMSFHKPDFHSPVVTTDSQGFRKTLVTDGSTPLSMQSFLSADSSAKGVILGSSTAFGVGASGDHHTIPSVLNQLSEGTWVNYGGRAYNSTQESLLFGLYIPEKLDHLVVISGGNNLVLAYLNAETSPVFNSFFSQTSIALPYESPSVREAFSQLTRALSRAARRRLENPAPIRDLSRQYNSILKCFRRDLRVLRDLGRGGGFRLSFVLQPIATWIPKVPSQEESELFAALDEIGSDWKIMSSYLERHGKTYRRDMAEVCSSLEVPFLDLNAEEAFTADSWLFVDRIHLTDQGYRLTATLLKERLGL